MKWVCQVNKGPWDPEVPRESLEMDLKTPCKEMPVPEVLFLKLPKVLDFQVHLDLPENLAKTEQKASWATCRYTILTIMLIW